MSLSGSVALWVMQAVGFEEEEECVISSSLVLKLSVMTPDEKTAAYITHSASQTLVSQECSEGLPPCRLCLFTLNQAAPQNQEC